jgi:hypothetical protein
LRRYVLIDKRYHRSCRKEKWYLRKVGESLHRKEEQGPEEKFTMSGAKALYVKVCQGRTGRKFP